MTHVDATSSVWEAFCDGASRGNPGPAAFGLLISDPGGSVVKEVKQFLGLNTNQVAEYEGLIRALQELLAAGARRARVFTDSEFVVKQVSGEYRVRDERMKVLMARVRELESRFESLSVLHVRRSTHPHNKRVDQLANMALDEAKKKSFNDN
ncbi:MAG: ribonuclease HI family protein [Elusimicrobia bacterium]|nr:ribonuclease HI family protein [Elusimicrobiota bacterium]